MSDILFSFASFVASILLIGGFVLLIIGWVERKAYLRSIGIRCILCGFLINCIVILFLTTTTYEYEYEDYPPPPPTQQEEPQEKKEDMIKNHRIARSGGSSL
ncbi:MAG: hypothetical protein WC664_00765 [Patescibacteria group bacterium]